MKKALIIILTALLVLSAFVSCEGDMNNIFGSNVTITFDGNGSTSGSMAALKVEKGKEVQLTANAFKKDGYVFIKWNTKADGSGDYYEDEEFFYFEEDTTLYAMWGEDAKSIPLTLEFIEGGKLYGYFGGEYGASDVYYSLNGETEDILPNSLETAVTVAAGDIVCLYRDIEGARSESPHFTVKCTSDCYVYGNVMSLITEDFATATTVYEGSFYKLFNGNTYIKNNPSIDLVLPATTLASGCYSNMFSGCTGLINVPDLPAETLADDCYYAMFRNCTSLANAPVISATTLASDCYQQMFYGCTSLTTAPDLPATTLANGCYYEMFYNCTKLNSITCLATSISELYLFPIYNWMYNAGTLATGTPTFYKDPYADCWTVGVGGNVPTGWTIKNYTPTT